MGRATNQPAAVPWDEGPSCLTAVPANTARWAAETTFPELLQRLEARHHQFLQLLAADTVEALKVENERLKDEIEQLKLGKGLNAEASNTPGNVHDSASSGLRVTLGSEDPSMPRNATRSSELVTSCSSMPSSEAEKVNCRPIKVGVVNKTSMMAVKSKLTYTTKRNPSIVSHGLDHQAESMPEEHVAKARRRLRKLLSTRSDQVSVESLAEFLTTRRNPLAIQEDQLRLAVQQLAAIEKQMLPEEQDFCHEEEEEASVYARVDIFAHLVCFPNLEVFTNNPQRQLLMDIGAALGKKTEGEAIDSATRGAEEDITWASHIRAPRWERSLNALVCICVLVSTAAMGIQVDYLPYHFGWFLLEFACTMVFVAEVIIKMRHWGCKKYFSGKQWGWNLLDITVTVVTFVDLMISGLIIVETPDGDSDFLQSLRSTKMVKVCRTVRVFRLVKLLMSPLLKDFTNMIVGLVIGLPSFVWVVVLFGLIMYVVGFVFRLTLGPREGMDLAEICGKDPDMFNPDNLPPDCKLHQMYGEEYFGSMPAAMFTTFRFMLGDYTTKSGKSLVLMFSEHYGMKFDLTFGMWMIVVQFGFFNIISALFVESTISGLKLNDSKRKLLRQYERNYVKRKLKDLMTRIHALNADYVKTQGSLRRISYTNTEQIELTEESFCKIMEDEVVKMLLTDLDVCAPHPGGLFDTFDPNGHGRITGVEFVEAVVKLRGEPHKQDVIASWIATNKLSEKIDRLHTIMLKSRCEVPAAENLSL